MQESSAARVAGKTFRDFTYRGKTYRLSQPLRYSSQADEQALILSFRRDPQLFGLRLYSRLPASAHAGMWAGCAIAEMGGLPSVEEQANYESSIWKEGFMLWSTLDPQHKVDKSGQPIEFIQGVTWAKDLMYAIKTEHFATMQQRQLGLDEDVGTTLYEELALKIAVVSQDRELKNSSGRQEPAPLDPKTENPSSAASPASTPTSEKSTDTDQKK